MSYNFDIPLKIEFGYKDKVENLNQNRKKDMPNNKNNEFYRFSFIDGKSLKEFMYGKEKAEDPYAPEILEQEFKKKLNEYIMQERERNIDLEEKEFDLPGIMRDVITNSIGIGDEVFKLNINNKK